MYRSCPLVQNFAKQGLKIRIRKESGPRPSRYINSKRKKIKSRKLLADNMMDEDEEEDIIDDDEDYNDELIQEDIEEVDKDHSNNTTTTTFKNVYTNNKNISGMLLSTINDILLY
jgi:hypothetical protein